MPTPSLNTQVIAGIKPDVGRNVECEINTADAQVPLVLSGFKKWRHERILVAPATTDQAFTFTDAVALILQSNAPITVRLAVGQAGLENLLYFAWQAATPDKSVHPTSILLSNIDTDTAYVDVLIVEKV